MDWEGFNKWDWEGFMDVRNMKISKLSFNNFCKLAVRILIFFIRSFVTCLGFPYAPSFNPR